MTTNETTPPQLPDWAIAAGWTEQDVADGWVCFDGGIGYAYTPTSGIVVSDCDVTDTTTLSYKTICTATTPAAARVCALDIVAAIKRARGKG